MIGPTKEHFGACPINIAIVPYELNKSEPLQRVIMKGFIQKNLDDIKENSYDDRDGYNPDYI